MRRALAFCRDIKSSKLVKQEFTNVIDSYLNSKEGKIAEGEGARLDCEVEHVDGTDDAKKRAELLEWLQGDDEHGSCRILSNARCLAEGVDVPALDAVLFMHPRKSQIDVVQAVGRVMRRVDGKQMGYIILPVGVPAGIEPERALNDNKRYRVVWDVLNALRSHDERLDSTINKASLGIDISKHIEIISVSDKLPGRKPPDAPGLGHGAAKDDDNMDDVHTGNFVQPMLKFDDGWSDAVIARLVRKCGSRFYWEEWAKDIAKIAQTHISRIKGIISRPGKEQQMFQSFLEEIRDDLNDSITKDEVIEMLAQHLITLPVFDALFSNHSFAQQNPVSQAMHKILKALRSHNIEKESDSLRSFYASVQRRVEGIEDSSAKQKIIAELYDKFFRYAFPDMARRLGIVYTPIEIVDFILRSVNDILKKEFGLTLGSKGVHIMDPFVGTGTFIVQLLQSGCIDASELKHKYRNEMHANEIVLLAYYIAAVNIETAYQEAASNTSQGYVPFEGICLTDTFQLYEQDKDLISELLTNNSDRRMRQKKLKDIRVIVGNPPYSVGQDRRNEGTQHVRYPKLDDRIKKTYAAMGGGQSLYDSYIRAIRWASDRIGETGVIGYVTNSGWLEGRASAGLRICLAKEFNSIYVLNLRGHARGHGLVRKEEGGTVFGSGSRTGISIMLLSKNPNMADSSKIYFRDIGKFLNCEEKLNKISKIRSIETENDSESKWHLIVPDRYGDWINQRSEFPKPHMYLAGTNKEEALFSIRSRGFVTGRDVWVYNDSKVSLTKNIRRTIDTYNMCVADPDRNDCSDATKIKWTKELRKLRDEGKQIAFNKDEILVSLYRPFNLRYHYRDKNLNSSFSYMPKLFPGNKFDNKAICIAAPAAGAEFSVLMTKYACDDGLMRLSQMFPLYDFPENKEGRSEQGALLNKSMRKLAVTDAGLKFFQAAYPGKDISKEDLFYYTYGFLHAPDYRQFFINTLNKELPRVWPVSKHRDFLKFVQMGRKLGKMHCNFDEVEEFPVSFNQGETALAPLSSQEEKDFYRVTEMKFAGKRPNWDKRTVIYNSNITITGIPLKAYDYMVNGISALEWIMKRQKASGDNDPNDFANEAMGDPKYPLKLFRRIITVSLETLKIVESLPPLDLGDKKK